MGFVPHRGRHPAFVRVEHQPSTYIHIHIHIHRRRYPGLKKHGHGTGLSGLTGDLLEVSFMGESPTHLARPWAASEKSSKKNGNGLARVARGCAERYFSIWVCIYSGEEARMSRRLNE